MASHQCAPSHELMRRQHNPYSQAQHHPRESSRWQYSITNEDCVRYPYQPSPTKRLSGELNGPITVSPTKHSRHFWPEQPHVQMMNAQGIAKREEPREWSSQEPTLPSQRLHNYCYQEYNGPSTTSQSLTPRRAAPTEQCETLQREVSRSYSDDNSMPHHGQTPSLGFNDQYYSRDNYLVSPRYSYRPEAHRTDIVPPSPTMPYSDKKTSAYFSTDFYLCGDRRYSGVHKDHWGSSRTGYHGAVLGHHPPSVSKNYHRTDFPAIERQAKGFECVPQGRDDDDTFLRTLSNCSDGSRDRHDGCYDNSHDREDVNTSRCRSAYRCDRSQSWGQQPPPPDKRRHHLPLVPLSHSESPRSSPYTGTAAAAVSPEIDPNKDNKSQSSIGAITAQTSSERQKPIDISPNSSSPNFNNTSTEPKTRIASPVDSMLLLAFPEDKTALSNALCIIRENVEVFRATPRDVDAPAPGRKNPVVVGQVGLRCIHCRHFPDRVKRAVCYPSSIRRIYRTITDMKLDHFTACPGVPKEIKDVLDKLKVVSSRSTGTTMRYFADSSTKLGLIDAESGVRFSSDIVPSMHIAADDDTTPSSGSNRLTLKPKAGNSSEKSEFDSLDVISEEKFSKMSNLLSKSSELLGDEVEQGYTMNIVVVRKCSESESDDSDEPKKVVKLADEHPLLLDSVPDADSIPVSSTEFYGDIERRFFNCCVLLSQKEDSFMLSQLRSFLRENVYAFSATAEDIATRTPTNFSITLGQVGVCCKHCYKLPPSKRYNRAVCFPFSIDRLYQSVADLQRFHFTTCKEVPDDVREKFESLKSASSKGSKGLATRQYWVTSAKKLGLVDSATGIKFGRDPCGVAVPALSLDILAQVAVNLTTQRPLVLPEDKNSIAEFLYYVMLQLQLCRFTEADRNKRRMKEVGCIGVECKHCVGQADSRKFFWSSVSAVESNFISVHTHLMECRFAPAAMKERLAELKGLRKEHTAKLKNGSQKAFFAHIWIRLHEYAGIDMSPISSFESSPPSVSRYSCSE